jgi:hypothetical protein
MERVAIPSRQSHTASAGVPRKLGFQLVREVRDHVEAPSEVGISCEWQLTRNEFARVCQDTMSSAAVAAALTSDAANPARRQPPV